MRHRPLQGIASNSGSRTSSSSVHLSIPLLSRHCHVPLPLPPMCYFYCSGAHTHTYLIFQYTHCLPTFVFRLSVTVSLIASFNNVASAPVAHIMVFIYSCAYGWSLERRDVVRAWPPHWPLVAAHSLHYPLHWSHVNWPVTWCPTAGLLRCPCTRQPSRLTHVYPFEVVGVIAKASPFRPKFCFS